MQSQFNNIEDDDYIKLLLAHIRKIQNIADVGIIASIGATVSIRKISYIIGLYNTNSHLYEKANI